MKLPRIAIASVLTVLCAGIVYAAYQTASPKPPALATYAPSGALLAIESPDFSSLLNAWTNSAEQKRWLASGGYAGFSRSRLFDRLAQAQNEFATTAGLPPDIRFLQQIAGSESLFAWYDIGKLEFLYITRLPSGQASKTPLLQLRDRFEERKAGDVPFYVRTQSAEDGAARTVAFAVQGDYLLLATREDLLANALQLMLQPANRNLRNDNWYSATLAVPDAKSSALRMSLHLSAIVRSPYFRTYWVQQNITEMKQYTAARSDLYRSASALREERVLIAANPENMPTDADLSSVLAYLPGGIGVYRAQTQPSATEILAQLDDKLLTRASGKAVNPQAAPVADLSVPVFGSASDFDERIDIPPVLAPSHMAAFKPLNDLIAATSPSSMLTFSTAMQKTATNDPLFFPIHSAVVLTGAATWQSETLESSLDSALLPQLSVAGTKLVWTQQHDTNVTWYQLSGPREIVFAIEDKTVILASDEYTLQRMLAAKIKASSTPHPATTIAGFSHTAERAPYLRLVTVLDHKLPASQPNGGAPAATDEGIAPPFFSGNIAGISETFRDLDTETFTQSTASDRTIHQTVVYEWKPLLAQRAR